jgi:hypothetical protein
VKLVRKTDRAVAAGRGFPYPDVLNTLLHAFGSREGAMAERVERDGLKVASELADFIEKRALPGTGVETGAFWAGFSKLLHDFAPRNRALLDRRAALQAQIDDWHRARRGQAHDGDSYKAFLEEIGYLVPEGGDFRIETSKIDPEIATVAGPQLVVPITNARFALNAANARWGSLYDALYGTDAMGSLPPAGGYDRGRGARVVARARVFLDDAFPIAGASHADIRRYRVEKGQLLADDKPLMNPEKFVGYTRASARARHDPAAQQRAACGAGLRPDPSHRRARPGASGRCADGGGGLRDHGLRGFGRLRRCRGQGAGLWQLAGPDAGRPGRKLREGRRDGHAHPQGRPGLYRAGRLRLHREGPRADAGAERGPPDDQPRDPAAGRVGGLRGADGRDDHHAHRQARPAQDRPARGTPSRGRSMS